MELYHLRTFVHLAKLGNFSRTADDLTLSQSAVSRHIEALEREFGLPLFVRGGRGAVLTEAGRRLLERAERILRLEDEAVVALRELQNLETGSLSLGASTTPGNYLLGSILARYRQDHPRIQCRVHIANTQAILPLLAEGTVDLGVLAAPPVIPPGLCVEPWAEDRLVLVAPPGHNPGGGSTSLEALRNQPFFIREPGSNTRLTVERHFQRTAFHPAHILEFGSTEAIKGAVAAGAGLAFLPACSVKPDLESGRLSLASGPGCQVSRQLVVAHPKGERLPPAALAFVALLGKRFAGEVSSVV